MENKEELKLYGRKFWLVYFANLLLVGGSNIFFQIYTKETINYGFTTIFWLVACFGLTIMLFKISNWERKRKALKNKP